MKSREKDIFFEDNERVKNNNLRKKRLIALIVLGVLIAGSVCAELIINSGDKSSISASMEIRCDQLSQNLSLLKHKELSAYIPEDGTALEKMKYIGHQGDTAVEMLKTVCKGKNIPLKLKNESEDDKVAVVSIGNLSEGEAGTGSGWIFTVNGKEPDEGCGTYILKENDCISWVYCIE